MGMRPALRVARRSGGGCRSGMADSSDNPRRAALRGLEESLRWHREAQAAPTAAKTPATKTPANPAAPPPDRRAKMPAKSATPSDAADNDLFLDDAAPPPALRRRLALPAFVRGRAMRRGLIALATLVTI